MTIHLTQDQEQRIHAVIHSGAYGTIEDVVEAALTAVEQRAENAFDGAEGELETLLLAGMDSEEIEEGEFWGSVDRTTNAMLVEHHAVKHS
jgi:Arc/MetJ-type ribon-helix-helix transcriptional regulator